MTKSRSASVSSRHGVSSRTAPPFAARISRVSWGRYSGLLHGSTACRRMVFAGSGTTRFRSSSMTLPNPWQVGHAPNGLLNENSRGSGAS